MSFIAQNPACVQTGLCLAQFRWNTRCLSALRGGTNTDWEKVKSIATHGGLEGGFMSVQSVSFSHGFASIYIFRVQNTSTGI